MSTEESAQSIKTPDTENNTESNITQLTPTANETSASTIRKVGSEESGDNKKGNKTFQLNNIFMIDSYHII